jgi:DNA ligase (NAD+)
MDNTQQIYHDLVRELNYHCDIYYKEHSPIISDEQYDRLYKALKECEKEHPEWILPYSPSRRVGNDIIGEFQQVVHDAPMLSIENLFSMDEAFAFIKKSDIIVAEPKIDGMSLAVRYEDGVLVKAITRGDGSVGEDVTHNAVNILDIPLQLNEAITVEVRGEVYMKFEEFQAINLMKLKMGEKVLANPRNAAAGAMKRKDAAKSRETPLHFFAYSIIETVDLLRNHCLYTQKGALDLLKDWGFQVQNNYAIIMTEEDVKEVLDAWQVDRKHWAYPTDGVVLKVNNFSQYEELGGTAKYPKWIAAYKYRAEQVTTKLLSITNQVGKMGVLTPVAELEPVELAGTVVKRASLHNYDMISILDLRIGDSVLVEKAGEIIPYVAGVDRSKRQEGSLPVTPPNNCPICNSVVIIPTDSPFVYCSNEQCPARVKARVKYFTEKSIMDIDGVGPAIIDQLIDAGMIRTAPDLYTLKVEDLQTLDRMGVKSAKKIVESIQKSKTKPFYRVLAGLQIPNTGRTISELLANEFENIDNIMNATEEQFSELEGIGEIIARSIFNYLRLPETVQMIDQFKQIGLKMTTKDEVNTMVDNVLDGKSFCVTGTLANFKRTEIQELIKQHGGTVSSGVSKNLSYLIAGEKAGSKLDKANSFGVTVISESEFIEMVVI